MDGPSIASALASDKWLERKAKAPPPSSRPVWLDSNATPLFYTNHAFTTAPKAKAPPKKSAAKAAKKVNESNNTIISLHDDHLGCFDLTTTLLLDDEPPGLLLLCSFACLSIFAGTRNKNKQQQQQQQQQQQHKTARCQEARGEKGACEEAGGGQGK
jgi:hypothetical protein